MDARLTRATVPSRPRLAAALLAAAVLAGGCIGSATDPLSQVRKLIERNDRAGALVAAKALLQQKPQLGEGRLLLGTLLLESGQARAAEAELRRALVLKQPEPQVVPVLARAMLASGQSAELLKQFGQTRWPDAAATARLKTTVAEAQATLGTLSAAEDSVAQALQALPGHEPALRLQVRLAAAAGDLPRAASRLDALLAAHPGSAESWVLKGDLLARQGADDAQRLQAYQQALTLQPAHPAAHAALMAMHLAQRDLPAARSQLARMRERLPGHPQTVLYEGQVAYLDGQLPKARELFQRLLRVMPEHLMALQTAGAVELQLNAPAQAEVLLNKALQIAPDNAQVRRLAARASLALGQSDRALTLLAPLIGPKSADPESLGLAAQAQLVAGQAAVAAALFERAVRLQPENPRARTALALAQVARGQADAGLADLQRLAGTDTGTTADMALVAVHMRRQAWGPALAAIVALEKKQPGTPLAAHLRGLVLQQQRDGAGARLAFEQALQRDPNYLPAVAVLAQLDLADQRPEAARARYEALVKAQPQNAAARVALADLGLRSGLGREAVAAQLEAGIRLLPAELSLRLALIDQHLGAGHEAKALQAAQAALGAIPDQPDLLARLGQAQLQAQEKQQALSTFRRLVGLQGRNPAAHLGLAQAQLAQGDFDGAARSVAQVLELQPDHLGGQRLAITLALRRQQPAQALAAARQVQKQHPGQSVGYLLEGDVLMAQKQWPAAVAVLRKAVALPQPGAAPARLHQALRMAGQQAEADALAQAWPQSHPSDLLFLFYLGDTALGQRDHAAAEARYRAVLAVNPDHALSLNNVAWLMLQQNKPGARAYAERAVKAAPDIAALRDTLAQALAAEQQYAEALDMQQTAVNLQPDDPNLRLNLARYLAQANQKRQAKAELDRLAALGDRFGRQAEVAEMIRGLRGRL